MINETFKAEGTPPLTPSLAATEWLQYKYKCKDKYKYKYKCKGKYKYKYLQIWKHKYKNKHQEIEEII